MGQNYIGMFSWCIVGLFCRLPKKEREKKIEEEMKEKDREERGKWVKVKEQKK